MRGLKKDKEGGKPAVGAQREKASEAKGKAIVGASVSFVSICW